VGSIIAMSKQESEGGKIVGIAPASDILRGISMSAEKTISCEAYRDFLTLLTSRGKVNLPVEEFQKRGRL